MSAKQDRVAPRTPADLESKYNFGKSFAEVMGIATDARKAADEAAKATVGTNLLTGTKDFSGSDWHNLNMWSVDGAYRGLTVMTRIGAWQGMKQLLYAEVGETYTVSAYVKSSGSFAFHFCMGNSGTSGATPGTRSYEAKSEWTRVSDTFTVTTAGIIAPGYEGTADSTQLWICGMKLEKGTRATEWCPATVETSVSHESVFNALTDNGKMQGVYRGEDGQIYINASYIKVGELLADLIKSGVLSSQDGTVKIDLNNNTFAIATQYEAYPGSGVLYGKFEATKNGIVLYGWDTDTQSYAATLRFSAGHLGSLGSKTSGIFANGANLSLTAGGGTGEGYSVQVGLPNNTVIINNKQVSWKANGDGTYTLIGT